MKADLRLARRALPDLEAASSALDRKNIAEAIPLLDRAIATLRGVQGRHVKKGIVAAGRNRDDRRAAHRDATATLREAVEKRSEGRCEACRTELGAAWEMHHVEGAGLRRSRQRLGSVLALCHECHRLAHRGRVDVLTLIASAPPLDFEAKRAALRRLQKVEEARRTPSVPVRIETKGAA